MAAPLLQIADLSVVLGAQTVLNKVGAELPAGGALAVVGESGSGKTTLLKTLIGLLPTGAAVGGSVRWSSRAGTFDLLTLSPPQWRRLRRTAIGWIPQEPSAALDPRRSARAHLAELAGPDLTHLASLFDQVGLDWSQAAQFPHQWSGGMQQRLLVAMAIARRPQLLLADEPTSALDTDNQAQLIALLNRLRHESGIALVVVTHDLAVAAALAETVAVLHHGQIVEAGRCATVLRRPAHAYTAGLLAAQPGLLQTRATRAGQA